MSVLPRVVHGIGVDLAHIPRFAAILANAGRQQAFLRKVLHPSELQHFRQHILPKPPKLHAEFVASRWAVKEATYKAFGVDRLDFRYIALHYTPPPSPPQPSVEADPSAGEAAQSPSDEPATAEGAQQPPPSSRPRTGRPRLQFYGAAKERMAREGISAEDCHVSISHEVDYAVAYVLLQASSSKFPQS